ncbi:MULTISPECIES: hypothetical protein [unclassified Pseudomonas]|uniref:hypothetical protein n=1 Tax=unclassified Pseudomonas TaxID=196821 RepID=UPI0035C210A1
MLKIVPDPPIPTDIPHSFEEILIQACEYLLCAQSINHQSTQLSAGSPLQSLNIATSHELDAARTLLEMALSKVHSSH